MMHLVVVALAVLWAWEWLLIVIPVRIPIWLQPVLVAGCAGGADHVPKWLLTAGAVAGAVALGHRVLSVPEVPQVIARRRTRRIPSL